MHLPVKCEVLLAEESKAEGLLCMITDGNHTSSKHGQAQGNIWQMCLKGNDLYDSIALYEEIWGYPKTFRAFQKIKPIWLVLSMYLSI